MDEEKPIVFTIIYSDLGYGIRTQDSRSEESPSIVYCGELSTIMVEITRKYHNKGYAVLFEVAAI